jgi:hypothetical protein
MARRFLTFAAATVVILSLVLALGFFYLGERKQRDKVVEAPPSIAVPEIREAVPPRTPDVRRPQPQRPEAFEFAPREPPAQLTPGAVTTDLARLMVSRYRPATEDAPAHLDLRLDEIIERYAPEELQPGGPYVYAVSPTALRLGSLLFSGQLAEKLHQEARRARTESPEGMGLSQEQSEEVLRLTAAWLRGVALCPRLVRQGAASPAPLRPGECEGAMDWVHGLLDRKGLVEVEAAASGILRDLAARIEKGG